ncbi:DnaA N-terminal domain-containing protein [Azospirillum canadense]|uniref:DnaA N-terminal domain-containing protein n=1 Tax=Azospirillum canadense TaxID=403962 RepID=UPI0022268A5A|nr:DnaA N-terminal domain-containing protein [Azospirillum canadense]MCW2243599.1 hypothetical protein [Azospirillum canadense]
MARIRSTLPGQWTDEDFVECQPLARLLAIGLRNEADDQGVFEWKPVTLKMRLMPVDNVDMRTLLADLEEHRQIKRFEVDGKVYGAIRNFVKYQRPKKPSKVHPLPAELRSWVRMDLWGTKKNGSESDADQQDDGSDLDADDEAQGSEPAHALNAPSSELSNAQRPLSSEPKPFQRTRVPKKSELAAQREEVGGKREVSTGIGKSSAGGPRAPAREEARPPAEDRDPGIPAAVSTVHQGLADAFERWFDLPDRPLTPADLELIEGWIAAGTERGLSPADSAAAAVEEVQRQFRRLDERGGGVPRSLRAVLDADVRTAIANAQPARSGAAGLTTAAEVPAPYAGYLTATEYTSWIVPCTVQADDTSATIIAPNRPIRDWVSAQLTDKLRAALCVTEITVELAAPSHRPDHAAA